MGVGGADGPGAFQPQEPMLAECFFPRARNVLSVRELPMRKQIPASPEGPQAAEQGSMLRNCSCPERPTWSQATVSAPTPACPLRDSGAAAPATGLSRDGRVGSSLWGPLHLLPSRPLLTGRGIHTPHGVLCRWWNMGLQIHNGGADLTPTSHTLGKCRLSGTRPTSRKGAVLGASGFE